MRESLGADPSVETVAADRYLIAKINDEMDYTAGPVLRPQFKELLARSARFIVLDLSGVSFCDSGGLNVAARSMEAGGCVRGCAGAGVCARAVAADPSDDRGRSASAGP
ncbi:STAS domain-containing protein [Streptomyces sp. NPDC059755]|uniref:STAS domain-containing protein n=1 Tax=Streptomyces sp. NPDC059755 TaxID=3346934 RepID=UPI00366726E6